MTHALLMLAFSVGVGLVLGLILRDDVASGLRVGAAIAASMAGAAILISWILYFLPL